MNYQYFIFLFLSVLTIQHSNAQFEDDELNTNNDVVEFAQNVIRILESTEAINQLILNRSQVDGQLQDINSWAQENKINPATYNVLKMSYEQYADHMNNVFDNLSSELRSIKRFKRIKKIRLDRIISDYSETYSVDLQRAYEVYNDSFRPAYELASTEAESKGFFSGILLILKFSEALFTTLSDLITNGKIGKKAEAKIIAYGAEVAISELKKKLYYEPWESIVLRRGTGSRALQGLTTQLNYSEGTTINRAPHYRAVDGQISLSFYESDLSIPLVLSSKEIVAGNDASKNSSIPEFATASSLKNGDKFWVKIAGYEYVEFFYFSDNSGYWKSPFGKEIVARSATDQKSGSTLYLPAASSFFEISGSNSYEEFLILASNSPIHNDRKNAIVGTEERGALFLEELRKVLGNVKQPWEIGTASMPSGSFEAIPLQQSSKEQAYIPIYIRINKD